MKKDAKTPTTHPTARGNGTAAKHAHTHPEAPLPEDNPPGVPAPAAAAAAAAPPAPAPAAPAGAAAPAPGAASPAPGQPAASPAASGNILLMAISQASQNVASANAAMAQIEGVLPGLISLPATERKITGGRYKDGEAQVLLLVLDQCAARPELVASLADEDNGVDPSTFETGLLSSRMQLAMLLAPLSASLTQLASNLDDTVLYLNELTKGPTLQAYAILKAVAKSDLTVRTAISPVLDFYSNIAKAAAATRKANAAAKVAAQAAPPAPASVAPAAAAASSPPPAK